MKTEELWRGEVNASTPHNGTESKGVAGGGGRLPDPEVIKNPVRLKKARELLGIAPQERQQDEEEN